MLVLTRKIREQIQIGQNITITILRLKGQAVRVGIDAPEDVRIYRGELTRNTGEEPLMDSLDEASTLRDQAETRPPMPRACHDRRFSSPLLAIATRRMRRRRGHFFPEGRI